METNKRILKEIGYMKLRKAYIDIEATYIGDYDIDKNDERDKCFKDFNNWVFCTQMDYNGRKIEYQGMIGILTVDFDVDEQTQVHKIISDRFVQLIGKDITKERLMQELDGINEILSYHGRTKPDHKGHIGYDFGVIAAQLGVILDELQNVKSIDLELDCHRAGIYGGLKGAERQIPMIPPRRSEITDGADADAILYEAAACEDENKRSELWKRAKRYNLEDVMSLPAIEKYIRKVKMIG